MTRRRLRLLLICLFLIGTTLAVYWQVLRHDFVSYDDNTYVTQNPHVQAGLTWEGVTWAFTSTYANFWHPLTWLSYMLDYEIYGLKPGGYHFTSLLFHIANTLLLFAAFKEMTGAFWQSAFVAALFALHPLHVESVAWVAERKDVLSTFFWMATMGSYAFYVKRPTFKRYMLILLGFTLGLMAKPMLVTLPFVLLLMDYWPLKRFQFATSEPQSKKPMIPSLKMSLPVGLIWEKVPLIALSAVFSVVTYLAQQTGGAVAPLSIEVRVANALVSYVTYIGKTIWPIGLAIHYPHPSMVPVGKVAVACLLLISISLLAIKTVRQHPYFVVGWLWYLGTLVPVIGLVQIGSFAMADRFTYVPLIGLFMIIAWGVPGLLARWRYRGFVLTTSTGMVLLALMICAWFQVRHWRSSMSLFRHTLHLTTDNWLAHNNLGNALSKQGSLEEAIGHYYKALRINPDYAAAYNNLGRALAAQGKPDEAIPLYLKALDIEPTFAEAHSNLGVARSAEGRFEEAIRHFSEALRIKPGQAETHGALGNALAMQGKFDEAIPHFSQALKLRPEFAEVHNDLGMALKKQGRVEKAIAHFSEALKISPAYAQAHLNIGIAWAEQGKVAVAKNHFFEAVRLEPDLADGHYNLGLALAFQGRKDEAITYFFQALKLKPDFAEGHLNLGAVLASQGKLDDAISHFSEALRIKPDFTQAKQYLAQALKDSRRQNNGLNTITSQ